MKKLIMLSMAVGAAFSALATFDGTPVTSAEKAFRVYVAEDAVYTFASAEDAVEWPVTWQSGDVVAATAMDGTEHELSDGTSAASSTVLPAKGGVWRLYNSSEGTATILVPWNVYGDTATLCADSAAFAADSVDSGPNRKSAKAEVLPISYSCDDWLLDAVDASTLTFLSPSGVSDSVANTGKGSLKYTFSEAGEWTVTLAKADGTVRTAKIKIGTPGLTLIIY